MGLANIWRSAGGGALKAIGEIPGLPNREYYKRAGSNVQNPNVDLWGESHGSIAARQAFQQNNVGTWGPGAQGGDVLSSSTGNSMGGGSMNSVGPDPAEVASLRDEIISRRERANSIFDALTGAVSALAASKRGELEKGFQREQQTATEQFGTQSKDISRAYRGRGLGESSYRINALEDAGKAFQGALAQLGEQRTAGLGEIGGQLAGQLARIKADRGSMADLNLDELGDDVGSLRQLRNNLDERIREAEIQQATARTPEGFAGQLNKVAPYGGTTNALKGALDSLLKSATPQTVKSALAQQIISNYDPDNEAFWKNYYEQEAIKAQVA